jgi:hypothetical protein
MRRNIYPHFLPLHTDQLRLGHQVRTPVKTFVAKVEEASVVAGTIRIEDIASVKIVPSLSKRYQAANRGSWLRQN